MSTISAAAARDGQPGTTRNRRRSLRPAGYANPYLAGVGIGLVLLAAYVLVGRGLGASGAFASLATAGAEAVQGPVRTAANPAFAPYLTDGVSRPLQDWLVLELLGVLAGAAVSAACAGRLALRLDASRGWSETRLASALVGGAIMGFGAKLARGCTSGQALTGGALLSVGSWMFVLACFAGAYALAPLLRRSWS